MAALTSTGLWAQPTFPYLVHFLAQTMPLSAAMIKAAPTKELAARVMSTGSTSWPAVSRFTRFPATP